MPLACGRPTSSKRVKEPCTVFSFLSTSFTGTGNGLGEFKEGTHPLPNRLPGNACRFPSLPNREAAFEILQY